MRHGRLVVVGAALVVALAAMGQPARAQPRPLELEALPAGPQEAAPPFVDLYTFEVGPVIFEKFGHATLCLRYHDEAAHPSICFNYGVTNFADGGSLAWGFLRSAQQFWVEPIGLDELVGFYGDPAYGGEDRTIWKQTLPLDATQARAIEAALWRDLEPANRYYLYDHFTDNCTTRLRDIIDRALGGALARDSDGDYGLTFRAIMRRGLAEYPPLLALSDFVVGRTLDRAPTIWEAMFLPEVLREQVALRLGAPAVAIWRRQAAPFPTDGPSGRGWALILGLACCLPLLAAVVVGRGQRFAALFAALPLTVLGLVIWGLAIVSAIPGLCWNEAVFLFVPFDALLIVLGAAHRRAYSELRAGMVAWVAILWALGIFKQPLAVPMVCAFVPHALIAWIAPMLDARRANRRLAQARGPVSA